MCGIAGFFRIGGDFLSSDSSTEYEMILEQMNEAQKFRGPDGSGIYLSKECGFAHVRLAIQDISGGVQPMRKKWQNHSAVITYNGEIYNSPALREELKKQEIPFSTTCDTEVLLTGYLVDGISFFQRCNGIFAFSIYDETLHQLLLCRDPMGVKPLFYTMKDDTLIFASEIKGLFQYPGFLPEANKKTFQELFALGPAHSPDCGVFKNVHQVLAGTYLSFSSHGFSQTSYWQLTSHPFEDSTSKTMETVRHLVTKAISSQLLSDVEVCTFLSGGLDSSIVTSISQQNYQTRGETMKTFSFDFEGNRLYFQKNDFQPAQDQPYVEEMVSTLHTNHRYLTCSNHALYQNLFSSVDARDLPCMADVESSLLYFCSKVSKECTVAMTGECADEIFGGYPWYHKTELLEKNNFPWSYDFLPRNAFLNQDTIHFLTLEEYSQEAYDDTIRQCPICPEDTPLIMRQRQISFLNLKWFMATLLERMDRTSMYSGLEARVPFADKSIVEYLWNVPWKLKDYGGMEKGLLRYATKDLLPESVLFRKKSPYPKTYHPEYEALVKDGFQEMLHDLSSPILPFIDQKKAQTILSTPADYQRPWYGQLMAGPQMLAYLLQVNYWMKKYHITA